MTIQKKILVFEKSILVMRHKTILKERVFHVSIKIFESECLKFVCKNRMILMFIVQVFVVVVEVFPIVVVQWDQLFERHY
jgi:hypothetical protein